MKFITKSFYIFVLFILYTNNFIYGQDDAFISIDLTLDGHNQYPQDSSSTTCNFTFILFNHFNYEDMYPLYSISLQFSNVDGFFVIGGNKTSTFTKIIKSETTFNNFTLYYTIQFGNFSKISSVSYSCQPINTNKLQFLIINNKYFGASAVSNFYTSNLLNLGVIKIIGLENQLNKLCIKEYSTCITNQLCDGCFPIKLTDQEVTSLIINPIVTIYNRTLMFNNQEIQLSFNSIFSESIISPNYTFNFKQSGDKIVGYNSIPLYTFSFQIHKPIPFFLSRSNFDNQFEIPNPVLYMNNEILYLGSVNTNLINSTTLSFYSQNYTSLSKYESLEFNATKINLNKLSNTIVYIDTNNKLIIPSNYSIMKVTNVLSKEIGNYKLYTKFRSYSLINEFPYGIVNSTTSSYSYQTNYIFWNYSLNYFTVSLDNIINSDITNYVYPLNSEITLNEIANFSSIYLYDNTFLFTISFENTLPIQYIELFGEIFRSECILSTDPLTFQFVKDMTNSKKNQLIFTQRNDWIRTIDYNYGLSLNNPVLLKSPSKTIKNIFSINSITYLYSTVNITNSSITNKMFIKFSQPEDHDVIFSLVINDNSQINYQDSKYHNYAKWNSFLNCFEIDFIIKANSIQNGYLPFTIYYDYINHYSISNTILPNDFQLNVVSNLFDNLNPIFTDVTIVENGWILTIQDIINGFNSGYLVIIGQDDNTILNYTLDSSTRNSGDQFTGIYNIEIPVYSNCSTQFFTINEVFLIDNQGYSSYFIQYGDMDPVKNPFLNFIRNQPIYNSIRICQNRSSIVDSDTTLPILNYFIVTPGTLSYTFQLEVKDPESGIDPFSKPIIYLKNMEQRIEKCISKNISFTDTSASYTCQISIPNDFGGFTISLYGIMNKNGIRFGCSDECISNFVGSSTFYTSNQLYPTINFINKFSNLDSIIWIKGSNLISTFGTVSIKYEDNSNKTQTVSPITKYPNIISVPIKNTKQNIYVTVTNSYGSSNEYKVTPIIFNDDDELPTNPPQQCKNNCGGSNKGYCGSSGCICYSPWIGDDCSSQIIIVPPPKLNSSNPSTEINFNNTNNQFYKSIISLVSIRELNIYNDLEDEYYFEKWVYTNISDTKTQYFTNITTSSNDLVNVTIILEWFTNNTNITFANQDLIMHASTMKYTITITKYPFKNQLNSLQLIMLASLETNNNDKSICSSQQYGSTSTGDNSDYIKIQIDKNSLYGRLIRRGIVDNKIRALSNQIGGIKNNKYNLNSNQYQSNTLIGINVGYYTNNVILDPDFSVLVDQNSANSNSPNSICHNSGLTKGQIAGIIVGSVVFFITLLVILGNIIYRSHKCLPLKIFIYKIFKKSKN